MAKLMEGEMEFSALGTGRQAGNSRIPGAQALALEI
jgi:hypothetical protein